MLASGPYIRLCQCCSDHIYVNSYCFHIIDGRKLKYAKGGCSLTFVPTLMNTHPLIKMLLWKGMDRHRQAWCAYVCRKKHTHTSIWQDLIKERRKQNRRPLDTSPIQKNYMDLICAQHDNMAGTTLKTSQIIKPKIKDTICVQLFLVEISFTKVMA